MTYDDVIRLLEKHVADAGTQAAFAKRAGITTAYVTDVLYRRRPAGPAILNAIGVRKVVTYEPVEPASAAIVYCDCGQPATRQMRLRVGRRMQTYDLCAKCAEMEVSA